MVANQNAVLAEIDAALGQSRPPDLEYILVCPYSLWRIPGTRYGIAWNAYGHAAVRYTLPDGTSKVMNIQNDPTALVTFWDPAEYLFGHSSPQGGLAARDMVSVRVERVPAGALHALDEYYLALQSRNKHGEARFDMAMGHIFAALRLLLPVLAERGNCAHWTSAGLAHAGLASRTFFPKSIFIELFEALPLAEARERPDNVHVVSYQRPRGTALAYGVDAEPLPAVAPLQALRSLAYWDLHRFAHVRVTLSEQAAAAGGAAGGAVLASAGPLALVHVNPEPDGPSALRNALANSTPAIGASMLLSLALWRRVLRRGR